MPLGPRRDLPAHEERIAAGGEELLLVLLRVPGQLVRHLRAEGEAEPLKGAAVVPPLPGGIVRDVRDAVDVGRGGPVLHGPRPEAVL